MFYHDPVFETVLCCSPTNDSSCMHTHSISFHVVIDAFVVKKEIMFTGERNSEYRRKTWCSVASVDSGCSTETLIFVLFSSKSNQRARYVSECSKRFFRRLEAFSELEKQNRFLAYFCCRNSIARNLDF